MYLRVKNVQCTSNPLHTLYTAQIHMYTYFVCPCVREYTLYKGACGFWFVCLCDCICVSVRFVCLCECIYYICIWMSLFVYV